MASYTRGRDKDRDQPSLKRSAMTSSVRSGAAAGRPSLRQPSRASSLARYAHGVPAGAATANINASRHATDRGGAISPAESMASVATAGGATAKKRKERDFESVDPPEIEQTNINVVVRCRGRNEREVREDSNVVVATKGVKGNIVDLRMGPNALTNKMYNFDRVFSPAADQGMLFDDVVRPVLDDMLAGYNCTIFAYGQTGTGKTYTMSGDMTNTFGMLSDAAGIIPRVLQGLFNKLESSSNSPDGDGNDRPNPNNENCVKVSFVELYNEELRDLISVEETAKLKIFDDKSKKGHTATVVQGLEEKHIQDAAAGIEVLQEGSLKRQVAATKCNDLSSRSHTIFTITAYVRRASVNGDGQDEYLQAGKLNLVDLAGSENIQRSGAENKRAAEAGLINKSLLTLGRVINALVDRNAHIPYRESKLTRLLQDSLGGRTKTCIIATISPAQANLEETISTLDYAFRAKNIQNKPQLNQPMNKKVLLRDFTSEIERLKTELTCHRQRNGVYLSNDAYEDMTAKSESRRVVLEEQSAKIETLETNLKNKTQELFTLTTQFMGLRKDHEGTKTQLDRTRGVLDQTELHLSTTRRDLSEEKHVRRAHQRTEEELAHLGRHLVSTLQRTVGDLESLHAKDKRRVDLEASNRDAWTATRGQVVDVTGMVEDRVSELRDAQSRHISNISSLMRAFVGEELTKLSTTQTFLDEQLSLFGGSKQDLLDQGARSKDDMDEVLGEIKDVRDVVKQRVGESLKATSVAAEKIAADVQEEIDALHAELTSSYGALDGDFKSVFEQLTSHLAAQRSESDRLRLQLEASARSMMEQNETLSRRLQEAIDDEKRQAAEGREQLIAQLVGLVGTQGQAQETRLTEKAGLIRQGVSESNASLEDNVGRYGDAVRLWKSKGEEVLREAERSREGLDARLKSDREAADRHSTSIRATAKSIHGETVRIIDEQVADLDGQMLALNDFVGRARAENARHHEANDAAVRSVASTVETSYGNIAEQFTSTLGRVEELGDEMEAETAAADEHLDRAGQTVCEPLTELREDVTASGSGPREYEPTGHTPKRTRYEFETDLPRTEGREALVAGMASLSSSSSPTKPTFSASAAPATAAPSFPIYSDTLPEGDGQQQTRSRSPPRLSAPTAVQDRNPLSMMSLWQVDPNVSAGAANNVNAGNAHAATAAGLVDKDYHVAEEPVAKMRRSTRRKTDALRAPEGRENVAPLSTGTGMAFSASVGVGVGGGPKRKSPRLQ